MNSMPLIECGILAGLAEMLRAAEFTFLASSRSYPRQLRILTYHREVMIVLINDKLLIQWVLSDGKRHPIAEFELTDPRCFDNLINKLNKLRRTFAASDRDGKC